MFPWRSKKSSNQIDLWGGWSIGLPDCQQVRNEDGSWSAWGHDWAIDVHIIEASGKADGSNVTKEELLGSDSEKERISGQGWIGNQETLQEFDNNQPIFRLATKLCADNTIMSCWVSYFRQDQSAIARTWVESAVHKGT